MFRQQFPRRARFTTALLAMFLIAPTTAHSAPINSVPDKTEATTVEKTIASTLATEDFQAKDVSRSSEKAVLQDDGITTSVTKNPKGVAKIDVDEQFSAGISLADTSKIGDGTVTPDGTAVFPVKHSADAFAFQILDGGSITASAVTTSPKSSRSFTYALSPDITPVIQRTGAVALYKDDSLVGVVEHPVSRDSKGQDIPSSYSVVDGDLVQTTHATASTAYPLVTTAKIGVFQTKGDYVHVTRGQASAHGWWVRGTAKATTAKVTVQLQYKPTKRSRWHNRGKAGVRTIKPGTSKRANARMTCRSRASKQWRSWVDVDLVGYLDTPNKLYTASRTLRCTL
ncbi:hypothetical protein [Micrococcoides hystricis]|uniref:Uncharacterized protein n=1 Tax=Micrococcoides hystricis TaxID=1572761 RepID=A0ABV6P7S9_9MICC